MDDDSQRVVAFADNQLAASTGSLDNSDAHSINIPSIAPRCYSWNSERAYRSFTWFSKLVKSVKDSLNFHLISSESRMEIYNPQGQCLQNWNRIILVSCVIAVALDALFLYIPVIDAEKNCLTFDTKLELRLCVIRSFVDIIYVLHIIFHFHTDIISPSRGFGIGVLVEDTVVIARCHLFSYFLIGILAVLPLPQVIVLITSSSLRHFVGLEMNPLLRCVILFQYFPRFLRIYPLYKQVRRAIFVTETALIGIAFNFFLYMLAGHIFGAFWYLLSLERKFTCQLGACKNSTKCDVRSLYCGDHSGGGNAYLHASCPIIKPNATLFDFGMYLDALQSGVVESSDVQQKLIFCFWWGLQNLGSLGQNLKTSIFGGEVLFAVSVSFFGLLLFVLLIGNVQMYLQSHTITIEREMRSKLKNAERWMSHIQLPEDLRSQVRRFEQYRWEKTRGFNDENLLQNLPKDLSRDIKCHQRLPLLRNVPLFKNMDRQLMDALCDLLKPVLYIKNSFIQQEGHPIEEMIFIMSGSLLSMTTDGGRTGVFNSANLKAQDFCGEELLSWALHPGSLLNLPISTRTVQAMTEVEAFALVANDLKFFTSQFRSFHSRQLQHNLRFHSQHWRAWAASFIQAAWRRYRRKRIKALPDLSDNILEGTWLKSGIPQPASWQLHSKRDMLRKRFPSILPKPYGPNWEI